MHFRQNYLCAVVMWGMIPLALFSGLPATGCVCANGQYKLFCAGALGRFAASSRGPGLAEEPSDSSVCPQCSGSTNDRLGEAKHSCCTSAKGEGIPCGKCCQLVKQNLATVSAEFAPPVTDAFVVAILPPALNLSLVVLPTISKHVEQIDTGPPVDRVIVLRCLLI